MPTQPSEQQVNEIGRQLAVMNIKNGMDIMAKCFHLEPVMHTSGELLSVLRDSGFTSAAWNDEKYAIIKWSDWLEIIRADWTDHRKWIRDTFDCDNFSLAFLSHNAEMFRVNSAGVASGQIYDKNTGKLIGGHWWTAIVAYDGGKLCLFFYEPITDEWVKYSGKEIIMGDWKYQPNWFLFS